MDPVVELRQLRYFVAVAEELHFGRAADRLHMSQSPLSRAIRELERDIGVTLFVRTTRHVELTAAGQALLDRARRALAEVDLAIEEARRAGRSGHAGAALGHGPFTRGPATEVQAALAARVPPVAVRLEEDVTPELLRQVGARRLAAAIVLATPAAAQRHDVTVHPLRDEPLLAALPAGHSYADAAAIPRDAFVAERVLLPRESVGGWFTSWLRAALLVTGHELRETVETPSAPWDRRMLPVADGEAVSVFVREWADAAGGAVAGVPFDPPLRMRFDLVAGDPDDPIVAAALGLRDRGGWLAAD